jgi:AcrR family transcriptional regulator
MTVRPERVPAEEVRQRMLDAGRELALEAGAALTIEHLRLEEVIQRARTPRSSVYRLWPYREEYTDDLLCYLAGAGSWFNDRPVLDPETSAVAGRVIIDNAHLLATVAGRRALLCEVVRVTCARNYEVLTGSAPWRLHMALITTLGSTRSGDARKRIAAALEDSQRRSRESLVALLGHLAQQLGTRMRDPAYTLDHVALTGGLLVQALALRNVQVQAAVDGAADGGAATEGAPAAAGPAPASPGPAHPVPASPGPASPGPEGPGAAPPEVTLPADPAYVDGLLNTPIPGPGLNGEPAQWTLAALSFLGVVDAFLELDPDFVPSDL